jgi:hypothetical protein
MTTKPALEKILKGTLHTEEKDKCKKEKIQKRINPTR